MRIAMLQMNTAWHDPEGNITRADELVAEARERNADLAVLPEMSTSGFSMDIEKVAEPKDGPSIMGFSHIARNNRINLIAGVSLREKGDVKARNSAVIFNRKGELVTIYTKCHPFSPAGEDMRYEAGVDPVVFELDGVR